MLHDLQGPIFKRMREYARYSPKQLGDKVGRSARTIERLEANDRELMVNVELQRAIQEATNVTKTVFGKIVAAALGDYLDRKVVIGPRGTLMPTFELLEAVEYYADHEDLLAPEDRGFIRGMLAEVQRNDLGAENLCTLLANEIRRRVDAAREAMGEDPSRDEED